MRHVLQRLAEWGTPTWVPPPGEREGFRAPLGRPAAFEGSHERAIEDQWLAVCAEQGTWWGAFPSDWVLVPRRTVTDALIADLDETTSNELFEELAKRGEDAEQLLIEEDADPEMPAPLYSTRWVRVSDQVFEQYAPLAQRRPTP